MKPTTQNSAENPLFDKAKLFALRIVKAYSWLKKNGESVMSKQLLRAGTSIGANIAEAQFAQSRADFISKLSIALKEASETRYWLELLIDAGTLHQDNKTMSLVAECTEIIAMLVSSIKSSKKRSEENDK